MRLASVMLFFVAALAALPALAQPKPAVDRALDNMQYLREKLLLDKKQLVAKNMELTEPEAKGFWPLYEEYQKELNGVNDRLATMIVSYSKELDANRLTDQKAKALLERYLAIEEAEVRMKRTYAGRLAKVLPGRKVARYLQIENKIRAIVRYEIAGEVPLAR